MENLDTDVIVERFNSMTILRLSCLLIDSGDKQFFFLFSTQEGSSPTSHSNFLNTTTTF